MQLEAAETRGLQPMITKSQARTKAASIKHTVDELHEAIDNLPAGPEKDVVVDFADRLHRKLNGAARRIAEVFEEDISVFSGGNDRPDEE